jgi:hypothetical protein
MRSARLNERFHGFKKGKEVFLRREKRCFRGYRQIRWPHGAIGVMTHSNGMMMFRGSSTIFSNFKISGELNAEFEAVLNLVIFLCMPGTKTSEIEIGLDPWLCQASPT